MIKEMIKYCKAHGSCACCPHRDLCIGLKLDTKPKYLTEKIIKELL